ncbi:hypothetical protein Golomagni_07203 [Golovinomyces magnicellulatus]|nr:hypothetical protein Golomagni_07203 [Golovinomyces magnicellulatus]
MEPTKSTSGASRPAGKQTMQHDSPEQLLDVFKAAALSVTKLYKTSALAESKARSEGYQDCLEDLLSFLDKENIGLCDGEGWRIRGWATERLEGRDAGSNSMESEDEVDKPERTESREVTRPTSESQTQTQATTSKDAPKDAATSTTTTPEPEEPYSYTVPSQDNFTFQSTHPYPNIATLDLSDSRPHDPTFAASRAAKARLNGSSTKQSQRNSTALGRGAGSKRRWDFDDFFGGCLGGKDPFGPGGKRNRHA